MHSYNLTSLVSPSAASVAICKRLNAVLYFFAHCDGCFAPTHALHRSYGLVHADASDELHDEQAEKGPLFDEAVKVVRDAERVPTPALLGSRADSAAINAGATCCDPKGRLNAERSLALRQKCLPCEQRVKPRNEERGRSFFASESVRNH